MLLKYFYLQYKHKTTHSSVVLYHTVQTMIFFNTADGIAEYGHYSPQQPDRRAVFSTNVVQKGIKKISVPAELVVVFLDGLAWESVVLFPLQVNVKVSMSVKN